MGVKLFDPQMLKHQPEFKEVLVKSEEALPLERLVLQLEKRYNFTQLEKDYLFVYFSSGINMNNKSNAFFSN